MTSFSFSNCTEELGLRLVLLHSLKIRMTSHPCNKYGEITLTYLPSVKDCRVMLLLRKMCRNTQIGRNFSTCKTGHVNDLLYLGGFFVHPVVSFSQFSHTVCCSVCIKIFQFNATFNINRSRLLRGLKVQAHSRQE